MICLLPGRKFLQGLEAWVLRAILPVPTADVFSGAPALWDWGPTHAPDGKASPLGQALCCWLLTLPADAEWGLLGVAGSVRNPSGQGLEGVTSGVASREGAPS